jgi:hypothetical protein
MRQANCRLQCPCVESILKTLDCQCPVSRVCCRILTNKTKARSATARVSWSPQTRIIGHTFASVHTLRPGIPGFPFKLNLRFDKRKKKYDTPVQLTPIAMIAPAMRPCRSRFSRRRSPSDFENRDRAVRASRGNTNGVGCNKAVRPTKARDRQTYLSERKNQYM